jgi:hypothetical protein
MIDVVTRFAGAAVAVSLFVCLRLFAHRYWKNVVLPGEKRRAACRRQKQQRERQVLAKARA